MQHGEGNPAELIHGLTVGDVAYWLDSIMLLVLIQFASKPFDTVLKSGNMAMARTFQVRVCVCVGGASGMRHVDAFGGLWRCRTGAWPWRAG
eukprot:110411-Chlamydomonas_euryale.AAC.1